MFLTRLGPLVLAATLPSYALQAPTPAVKPAPAEQLRSTYVLGPEDQIAVRALDADEISDKPIRIDMSGNIRLPMVGRLRASGLTIEQLEAELVTRLRTYIREPEVAVSIVEFRSQPISVIGSVRNPGVHQLQGRKTLVEILSLAGGLAPDAGHSVKITRRLEWGRIPLRKAGDDPSGQFSVADVSLRGIMEAKNPDDNITIRPHDVISVPRAEMVYVIGQVQRAGGFILNERENLSVLKALSLAGGLDRTASRSKSRDSTRTSSTCGMSTLPSPVPASTTPSTTSSWSPPSPRCSLCSFPPTSSSSASAPSTSPTASPARTASSSGASPSPSSPLTPYSVAASAPTTSPSCNTRSPTRCSPSTTPTTTTCSPWPSLAWLASSSLPFSSPPPSSRPSAPPLRHATPDGRALAAACFASMAAILLHGTVDFNLYIPANTLVLAWISSIGAAVVLSSAPVPVASLVVPEVLEATCQPATPANTLCVTHVCGESGV